MAEISRRTVIARPAARPSLSSLLGLWRQRRHLARLDDHALEDIGLDRAAARQEASRPFWDVPAHWRQ